MNDVIQSNGRKRREPIAADCSTLAPEATSSPEVTYTLKVLSTVPNHSSGEAHRIVLFQRLSEGQSLEITAQTDSQNLLAKLPEFLDATLEIQKALWPAQRVLTKVEPSFFPLLTEEARLLRRLSSNFVSAASTHEFEHRRIVREAMIVRDIAWESLRNALDPKRRREVDALVGLNESPTDLAVSMDAIADYIDAMLSNPIPTDAPFSEPNSAGRFLSCEIDSTYVKSLRQKAANLRAFKGTPVEVAPESMTEPNQGGVVRLIGIVYRALRTEAFMAVPAIHKQGWLFGSRSKARIKKAKHREGD